MCDVVVLVLRTRCCRNARCGRQCDPFETSKTTQMVLCFVGVGYWPERLSERTKTLHSLLVSTACFYNTQTHFQVTSAFPQFPFHSYPYSGIPSLHHILYCFLDQRLLPLHEHFPVFTLPSPHVCLPFTRHTSSPTVTTHFATSFSPFFSSHHFHHFPNQLHHTTPLNIE